MTEFCRLIFQIGRHLPRFVFLLSQSFSQRSLSALGSRLGGWLAVWIVLTLLCFNLGLFTWGSAAISNAAATIQTPLSTQGSRIVDAAGRTVLLRGVNWFGLETNLYTPHGLWARDYKEILAQIKSLGYNVIRLPFSVKMVLESDRLSVSSIDFAIGNNRDFQDKRPLEVMDLVVQEARRQGLLILLDAHRLDDQRIPELWYGDGFTEAQWIQAWTSLATRYQDQPQVIGADLKNEPHGQASWGTGNPATDWRLAAERAGNAIARLNPNWLIVVEGVEKNVPGQKLPAHWWGGNLEGVKNSPVRLNVRNKLVYSPHEYGPGVVNQPWFAEPSFPNNLLSRWQTGFQYIADQGIAPVLIGEFGGRQVDATSKEGIWQRRLVDFIAQKRLHFTYWSWNPNSADTGGLLGDDWRSLNADKQMLLSKLLPTASPMPSPVLSPSPSSEPTPSLTPSPIPSLAPGLQGAISLQSDWADGFCANLRVTNPGSRSVQNWQLNFRMNQAAINNTWNGNFRAQGGQYIVTPPDWGRTLQPGQSIALGFCAKKLGGDYQPSLISVSGS